MKLHPMSSRIARIASSICQPSRRQVIFGAATTLGIGLAEPVRAQAPGLLRVVNSFEFRTLRPSETGFTFTRTGVAATLVATDFDGRIVPALAEDWVSSPDGLEWWLTLRAGVVFHDGTPMTAELVKASFEKLVPQSLFLKSADIRSIETTGRQIVFRLERPFGPFLAYLADTSVFVLAPASFSAQGEVAAVIGTGPFRIARANLPRELMLARHDGYWGRKPAFAQVQYDAVSNGETRANIAAAGDADLVLNIPTPSLARVGAGGRMRTTSAVIPRTHILMPNCAKPQFADARTRRALSLAIDRAGIAGSIMRNPSLAATH